MNFNRFTECCAAYGAAPRRWPEAEQPLYDHFATTMEGAVLLAEAERTDRYLDALAPAALHPHFVRDIVACTKPAWRRFGAPVAALAASGLLGCLVGFVQVQTQTQAQTQAQATADTQVAARWIFGPQSLQELGL
jgi:negative regulator of sigma E activity